MSTPPFAPRRLRRSVRVIGLVAISYVAALAVGRHEHLAAWWSIFLSLGALVAVVSVHPSQQLRLVTLLFGAVPFVAESVRRSAPDDVELEGVVELIRIPTVGVMSWVFGEMLDAARVRFLRGPRAYAVALGAAGVGVLALTGLVARDACGSGPDRAALLVESVVVVSRDIRLVDDGITDLAGHDLDCETTADGALACVLERTAPRAERQRLPRVVERVRARGRIYLRPPGSTDLASWVFVDERALALRPIDPSMLPRPRRVPRSSPLALALGGIVVVALGFLRARDRRMRAAILGGIDAVSDGELVEANGQRLPITAPSGPVVLLGTRSKGGAYRVPPSVDASAWVAGTRHGRSLRLAARITRLPAMATLVLALTMVPLVVALLSGETLSGAP